METVRSADGTTIAYDRSGDGPPLVLVVGAFCDRLTTVDLVGLLEPQFTVFAYDRRGRGDSGDTQPYAVDREVEDLLAIVAAADGPVHLYGHSSGAILALEAVSGGLPVDRLAVYEPPYVVDDSRNSDSALLADVCELLAADRRAEAMAQFLLRGPGLPPEVVESMPHWPNFPAMEAIAPTLRYDLTLTGDQRPPLDRFATITAPTLALSGGDSDAWAGASVAAIASAIPGARHLALAGQTHNVAPEVLAPVLRDHFLG